MVTDYTWKILSLPNLSDDLTKKTIVELSEHMGTSYHRMWDRQNKN